MDFLMGDSRTLIDSASYSDLKRYLLKEDIYQFLADLFLIFSMICLLVNYILNFTILIWEKEKALINVLSINSKLKI